MLDPNIALQYKGMQLNDPMEQAGKAMALSQMAQQNQFMQQRMEESNRATTLGQMRGQAYMQSGGDPSKLRQMLMDNGDHEGVMAHDNQQLAAQKAQGELASQRAGLGDKLIGLRAKAAQFAYTGGTTQHAIQAAQLLHSSGDTEGAKHIMQAVQQFPDASPEQVRQFFQPHLALGQSPDDLLNPKYEDFGGEKRDINPRTNLGAIQKTQTPDSIASNAQSERNQNRIDARAKETIAVGREANTLIGGKQAFEAEHKLADDHKTESKTFIDLRDGYTRIKASLGNATKSAAATLAGATSFMKLLDPGSVVRESELGMALAASGILDRATNYHNTLLRGKVLTESQAKDFKQIADKIYKAAEANQRKLDAQYTEKAKGYGLKPENVVKDYSVKTDSEQREFKSMPPASDHAGKRIRSDDGTIYKSNGKSWVRE